MADIKAQHFRLVTQHHQRCFTLLHKGSKVLHHQSFLNNYKLIGRRKGEIISRVIISNTTTAVHYLSSTAFFFVSPVCTHGIQWRHADVDCCPQVLYHRGFRKFHYKICRELHT